MRAGRHSGCALPGKKNSPPYALVMHQAQTAELGPEVTSKLAFCVWVVHAETSQPDHSARTAHSIVLGLTTPSHQACWQACWHMHMYSELGSAAMQPCACTARDTRSTNPLDSCPPTRQSSTRGQETRHPHRLGSTSNKEKRYPLCRLMTHACWVASACLAVKTTSHNPKCGAFRGTLSMTNQTDQRNAG